MPAYLQNLVNELLLYGPRLAGSLMVFVVFWVGAIVAKRIIKRVARFSDAGKKDILAFVAQILKISLIVVGLVSALGTLGINVTAMVAGLGLTGFALSFALKDVLSNAVAGILVLFYRPFVREDTITVSGFKGKVVSVDLRYTTLQNDQDQVLIPNAVLFTQTVSVHKSQR